MQVVGEFNSALSTEIFCNFNRNQKHHETLIFTEYLIGTFVFFFCAAGAYVYYSNYCMVKYLCRFAASTGRWNPAGGVCVPRHSPRNYMGC